MNSHWKQRGHAWAIWNRDLEALVGIFWFISGALEPCQDGCRTALFRTRKEARSAVAETVGLRGRCRIVRVAVKLEEHGPTP